MLGRRSRGGQGRSVLAAQILAYQLTLSQPGGRIMPTILLIPQSGFSALPTAL